MAVRMLRVIRTFMVMMMMTMVVVMVAMMMTPNSEHTSRAHGDIATTPICMLNMNTSNAKRTLCRQSRY